MNLSNQRVKDVGEQGLLKILKRYCPQEIVGDDAAVLSIREGRCLVVTTDVLVDGVHFSDRTTAPEDVGWRAVAANLSDLAAMGADALGITVGLALPGEVAVNWVERVYQGMNDCLQKYDSVIYGGDVCRSSVMTVSITALGEVMPERVIRRNMAQPGDAIVITGYHGCSRGGLELLLQPEKGAHLTPQGREGLIQAHQRPNPRLDVLAPLWEVSNGRVGGMDSSDGLADAIVQICEVSGVGAYLEYDKIPIAPQLKLLGSFEEILDWVLYGGEDFELVLSLPYESAEALVKRLGEGAAIIGEIISSKTIELLDSQGVYPKRVLSLSAGFQHF
ncbi:thiamine-monophosphate kinase [Gloeothece citriformis PCC 7424]|uniref:Thiamine-monophosphate kinase n=1 Tax=Gloeothece citriformis (strain PCC 7424) TaxID=65393 RepID=B7KAJ1_GLOC7|nr:thiamine-phosphate kinase [Gloeothece citriformis]ACK68663.1 thiamine-monophosphate kinase [Gloeothece citriformis PCC 7424]